MIKKNFLVEIGTEELPAKKLNNIAKNFKSNFVSELLEKKISYQEIKLFFSPRRLAIKVKKIYFNKKNTLYLKKILPEIVLNSLKKISVVKFMRWGEKDEQKFIRPINNVTMLLNDKLISGNLFGINSNRIILSHRFMAKKQKLLLKDADYYEKLLFLEGKVIVDYQTRKNIIQKDIKNILFKEKKKLIINNNVLEEVNSLVEWPIVMIGKFRDEFLLLPEEILIIIMEKHQRYFPIYDENNKLISKFIFVSNIETKNKQKIVQENEKVLNAKFSDAKYFFDLDRKKNLNDYLPELKNIIFHEKLGSMFDKTERIKNVSIWLSKQIGANTINSIRAALLSKCDLMTNMVCEFTEAQGIIGMHYAYFNGEEKEICIAMREQYQPNTYKDKVPNNLISCILSIADKIDTIVGMFGLDINVTSDRDPFGLRRISLSIMRIIVENNILLNLRSLIEITIISYNNNNYKLKNKDIVNKVINFMFNRLFNWYKKNGYSIDILQSVMKCKNDLPIDFYMKLKAIKNFYSFPESIILSTLNKRICNILSKTNVKPLKKINHLFLIKKEEFDLVENIKKIKIKIKNFIEKKLYIKILFELVKLDKNLNNFFKNVMINADEKNIKINRITILFKIKKMILLVSDLSDIAIKKSFYTKSHNM